MGQWSLQFLSGKFPLGQSWDKIIRAEIMRSDDYEKSA
jgi:hypothetical protein